MALIVTGFPVFGKSPDKSSHEKMDVYMNMNIIP
jgi:hypothetical protein